jgi:hypothetical protein
MKGAVTIDNICLGLIAGLVSVKESFQKESKSMVILVGIVIKRVYLGSVNWMYLKDYKHSLNTRILGLAERLICYSNKVWLLERLK